MLPKFHMPTCVFMGENCLFEKTDFLKLGKKPIIITGKNSGTASGALPDVLKLLQENKMDYVVFDQIINNPTLENVDAAGIFAKESNADFVIAIGGGSPLDAAKAVSVLASNNISAKNLFDGEFKNKPLPIVAIPTTAGTGSEVTPYSILTVNSIESKRNFSSEYIFPKYAYLDAKYTENLPYNVCVNTAVDAFSHSLEGYLCNKSSVMTDYIALEAIKLFSECIKPILNKSLTFEIREKLLYMSMLSGIVIAHTGTTIVHGMGYNLTYFKNIPHGLANGLLLSEFLKFNYDTVFDKIESVFKALKIKDIFEFEGVMKSLISCNEVFTRDEILKYSSIAIASKSLPNNPKIPDLKDITEIYSKSLKLKEL